MLLVPRSSLCGGVDLVKKSLRVTLLGLLECLLERSDVLILCVVLVHALVSEPGIVLLGCLLVLWLGLLAVTFGRLLPEALKLRSANAITMMLRGSPQASAPWRAGSFPKEGES